MLVTLLPFTVTCECCAPGWRVELGREGCLWICKVWTDTGTVDGVKHYEGQRKRTWEVLRDEGVHSYRIEENENYKVRKDGSARHTWWRPCMGGSRVPLG